MQAGFRESGAINLTSKSHPATPLVAVRSSGLGFDCLVGYVGENGHIFSSVSENCLKLLVQTANERFKTNTDRVSRFRSLLLSKYEKVSNKSHKELKNSQDAGKRQEGFTRQKQEMQAAGSGGSTESTVDTGEDHLDLNTLFD
jgi:tRNA wybutosine-synthesizing protein 3